MITHQPKGGMCAVCTKIGADCSHLKFAAMPVISEFKKDDKLVKVVNV